MRELVWIRPLLAGVSAIAVTAAAEAAIAMPAPVQAQAHRFHYEPVLGTTLDIVAMAPDEGTALLAMNAARVEIARLEKILSTWRPDSELARLPKDARIAVSEDLFAVLEACEKWRIATHDAFDARLGALVSLWREAGEQGVLPARERLVSRAHELAAAKMTLDVAAREIMVPQAIELSVDGLAKGYIIDAALAAAQRAAPLLQGMMLNIGGDLRCWGASPQGACWHVGVSDPEKLADNARPAMIVALQDRAVATSGKGLRDHVIRDQAYSHILSPQSGAPLTQVVSATVVARKAADADALATAFSVLAPSQSLALAESLDDVEAMIVTADGRQHASLGWPALVEQSETAPGLLQRTASFMGELLVSSAQAASDVWPAGFELKVDFEIPQIESSNYKKPYLAIWVTDENKKLVRHVALLGNEQKWIDSNYVWWRRFGRKSPNVVETMTRPTLAPGQHSVVWDGRDDKGNPVTQGRYMIHIEATREHGGHSYRSIAFDVGEKPAEAADAGADELGATKISFGRRG